MQPASDAVPAQIANHEVAPPLHLSFDGPSELGDAYVGGGNLQCALERRLRALDEVVGAMSLPAATRP